MKGLKIRLIEREILGGTCLSWGCFPEKIASSEYLTHLHVEML
jgi:pyruvate/2-oxoglutarate dehydrogenase complex dihydrolipoamide dehydrogenase (E3) component